MDPHAFVTSADRAAALVLDQARQAEKCGTFAVGGLLLDNATGKVIHALHNSVRKPLNHSGEIVTFDPTAHGERLLAYWYFANQKRLGLPPPDRLTLVTSLDPCAMCAGALVAAGFNVGVVAMDGFAGVNWNRAFAFESLSSKPRESARSRFGYYACTGGGPSSPHTRAYKGGGDVALKDTAVSAQTLDRCGAVFLTGADRIRRESTGSGLCPGALTDPGALPQDSSLKQRFKEICPESFRIQLPRTDIDRGALMDILTRVRDRTACAKNSAAFFDPFGNLLVCLADTFDQSPLHTAFMNVTQAYAAIRFRLLSDDATRDLARHHLTHPKYGTFVWLHAPDPGEALTLMSLGAFGSTMEGPLPRVTPSNLRYVLPPLNGDIRALREMIRRLPPFYTRLVGINPEPI